MAPRTKAQRAHALAHPETGIRCSCGARMSDVIETRERIGRVYRRRACQACGARVATVEQIEHRRARRVPHETHTTGSVVRRAH